MFYLLHFIGLLSKLKSCGIINYKQSYFDSKFVLTYIYCLT